MGILKVVCSHRFTTQKVLSTFFYGQTWICWFLLFEKWMCYDAHNCINDAGWHNTEDDVFKAGFVSRYLTSTEVVCHVMQCVPQTWRKQDSHHSVGGWWLLNMNFKHNKLWTDKLIGKSLEYRHQCPSSTIPIQCNQVWGTKYILKPGCNYKTLLWEK